MNINALPVIVTAASVAAVPFLTPWQRLVVLIVPLCAAIKTAVLVTGPGPHGRGLVAAIAWPGFDPRPFRIPEAAISGKTLVEGGRRQQFPGNRHSVGTRETRQSSTAPAGAYWIHHGLAVMALGGAGWAALVWFAPHLSRTVIGWLGIAVILTTVHLGLFDVITGTFRRAGFDVRRLFQDPLMSRSLTDFWGRRWNLAYVELNLAWLLPLLRPRLGRWAKPAAFGFSGLFHELAISVPVGRGYGGPMAYFTIHAVLAHLEPRLCVARWPAPLARLWTWAWLLVPLPLLFHSAFRDALVVPLFTWRNQ